MWKHTVCEIISSTYDKEMKKLKVFSLLCKYYINMNVSRSWQWFETHRLVTSLKYQNSLTCTAASFATSSVFIYYTRIVESLIYFWENVVISAFKTQTVGFSETSASSYESTGGQYWEQVHQGLVPLVILVELVSGIRRRTLDAEKSFLLNLI